MDDGIPRYCGVCGCTDEVACPGGCKWNTRDRCSACAGIKIRRPLTVAEFHALQDVRHWAGPNFQAYRRALSAHLHAGRITVRRESGDHVWRITPAGRRFLECVSGIDAVMATRQQKKSPG